MSSETHSLSFPNDLWIDLCNEAKSLGFKEISKFFQYLGERHLYTRKYDKIRNTIELLVMLMGFTIIIFILLLVK